MKNNVFKIIGIIILILILLFLINLFMNYSILSKICDSNEELKKSLTNYYYIHNTEYTKGDMKNFRNEIYCYDGIYLSKTYADDTLYTTFWYDSNTNETLGKDSTGKETTNIDTEFIKQYEEILLNRESISKILWQNLFIHLNNKYGYYVIKIDDITVLVDAETKLIKKYTAGDTISTFDIKTDTVTSEDVKKENI